MALAGAHVPPAPDPERPGDRGSLTERAYAAVKARILGGDIAPNAQIDEMNLAKDLGISRTPVREALQRLQHEGLVSIARGKGIHVLSLSSQDMRELYQAITGLEVTATFLLAGRQPVGDALAPLEAAVRAMENGARRDDLDQWGQADEAFHRALIRGSGNRHVEQAGLMLRDRAQRAHLVAVKLQPLRYLSKSTASHAALLKLIRAGDAERAAVAHFQQRRRGEDALVSAVEKFRLTAL